MYCMKHMQLGCLTFHTIHQLLEDTLDTLRALQLHLPEFGKVSF